MSSMNDFLFSERMCSLNPHSIRINRSRVLLYCVTVGSHLFLTVCRFLFRSLFDFAITITTHILNTSYGFPSMNTTLFFGGFILAAFFSFSFRRIHGTVVYIVSVAHLGSYELYLRLLHCLCLLSVVPPL